MQRQDLLVPERHFSIRDYMALPRTPTTAALAPCVAACAKGTWFKLLQNGRVPTSSKNPPTQHKLANVHGCEVGRINTAIFHKADQKSADKIAMLVARARGHSADLFQHFVECLNLAINRRKARRRDLAYRPLPDRKVQGISHRCHPRAHFPEPGATATTLVLCKKRLHVVRREAFHGHTMIAKPVAKVEGDSGILAPAFDVITSALIMIVDHPSEWRKNIVWVFSSKTEVEWGRQSRSPFSQSCDCDVAFAPMPDAVRKSP